MAEGLMAKEIALAMGVKKHTVDIYLDRLRRRFNAKNGPHLVAILFRQRLLV